MNAPKQAPLYTDTTALCEWLLRHFSEDQRSLPQRICNTALDLLDAVVLALHDRHRHDQIEQADERLLALRTQLRLAAALGIFSDSQLLHILERADTIGRQLGGWRRRLGPV